MSNSYDIDSFRAGAKFALESIAKVDDVVWLVDSMKEICIRQAAEKVIEEVKRMRESM